MSSLTSVFETSVCGESKKAIRVLALMMLLLLSAHLPLFSQGTLGVIEGGVFDQTGGAIAGATVTVIDVARGNNRVLTTDAAGQYVATNVTPGTYTVRAEAKGFRTEEHTGVLLEVGQNVRVDLVVQPGEQTQTVTVTGEVPAIDTSDSTLGGTISNQAINSLPLNGRNFERLLQLRPGVFVAPGSGTGAYSTNGRRSGSDSMMVEGLTQMGPSNGSSIINYHFEGYGDSASLLPIDAIQEFNTEQAPKAEYGWRDGSVVLVGIKSGTNSIHGSAYAFGRDASATDAANYFTSAVTPAALEQFGATLGGPILKDKLFWFVGYEGLRANVGDVANDLIPSDVSFAGAQNPLGNPQLSLVDACNAVKAAGKTISPLTALLTGLNTTTCVVSPASSTFENVYPFVGTTSNLFAPGLPTSIPLNNGIAKIDYSLGPHHHLNGVFYDSRGTAIAVDKPGELEPQWELQQTTHINMDTVSWTWAPSSNWVNELRGGYAFLHQILNPVEGFKVTTNPWPSGYGFNAGQSNPLYAGMPEIDLSGFTGFTGLGQRTLIFGPEGTFNVRDNVSYLRGTHAFKFGFEFLNQIFDGDSLSWAQGDVKFSSTKTFTTLEEFLQGIPKGGTILVGNPLTVGRLHDYAGFFQDDWRVTKRVTLNLGLRYEYSGIPSERYNYVGNFNPNVNPATTPAVSQGFPGLHAAKDNFSPRFGLAWDVRGNGKTVVRAGASLMTLAQSAGTMFSLAPFGANFPTLGINNAGTAIAAHDADQLTPVGCGAPVCPGNFNWSIQGPVFATASQTFNGVTYTGLTCTPAQPCFTAAVDPNFKNGYTAEWNLDIQRAITNNLTLDVAYVGIHGFREESFGDINQPETGAGWDQNSVANCLASASTGYNNCNVDSAAEQAARPYNSKFPYLNYIIQLGNNDHSNYDALQVTVNERVSHGLSFLAGYTWAHALDMLSTDAGSFTVPTDDYNLGLDYGNSSNDIRHRFTFSPTYAIPGMKSPGQMLQGWTVSGIVTLQTGLPWFSNDTTNDLTGTNEVNNSGLAASTVTWNYSGPRSAFTSAPTPIPCFGHMTGCTQYVGGVPPTVCLNAATAAYPGNAQLQQLAIASLTDIGCYVQNGGVLTPPAYGQVGNSGRNVFRGPHYYNLDFSVGKDWKLKERMTAQLRFEFFNILNRADFAPTPAVTNPNSGGQFGCSCATPDSGNPVLGSGGPRHVQFGLKLLF
jgi:hypothetical protein